MATKELTYMVREELTNGNIRYFAAFVDGTDTKCEAEIPQEVYLALEEFRKDEHRQQRSARRHQERLSLTEPQLAERGASSISMEDGVNSTLLVQSALETLSDTQRRRFLLYHEHGLSYAHIADLDNCKHSAIVKSVCAAQGKLEKYILEEGYKTEV